MPDVHLICGPVAAGKTTFARELEERHRAVRFSIDEWMLRLYGPHMPRDVFHQRLAACMDLIYGTTERLCAVGVSVVLDCGFWRREHRAYAIERLATVAAHLELHYLAIPSAERWARLERRNADLPHGTYEIKREEFDFFETCFEPPAEPEVFTVRRG